MSEDSRTALDTCLERFAGRLPDKIGGFVRWITGSASALFRIPVGLALIAGGVVGFLPVLGFWMVPLGLAVIALDIPFLRPPLIRLLQWIERKWPQRSESR